MIEPKNGIYLNRDDFDQWQNVFSTLLDSEDRCTGNCSMSCDQCSNSELSDPDLKVKNITFVVTEQCNLNCSYCVPAGTKILMADLTEKNIEDVKINDIILGFNEHDINNTRKIKPSKVLKLYKHIDNIIRLIFEDNTFLDITKNHSILLKNKDWQIAENCKIDDDVYFYTNINKLENTKKIKDIQKLNKCNVYNIGTETRTYFANNIAVHNCYEVHKTGRKMTKDIAKTAVDFIFDEQKINGYYNFKTSPAVILEFIGGEPLLEIDLMDYIIEYFKFKAFNLNHPWAVNYMINFTSNGVLYKTEKVQNFIKRNMGKVSIGITIDGNKKLHDSCRVFPDGSGSYDIVEEAIKDWIKFDDKPQTKITLCPENVGYLNDALKNVWALGIIGAYTNCVFEEGWNIEHAKILYNEMIKLADYLLENENYKKYYCSLFDDIIGNSMQEDRNWCGGNGQMLAIAPDGKCFPCIRFMKYSLATPGRKEQSIGNIYNGLEKKEENEWLNKLRKITLSSQSTQKCIDCPISTGCALCTGYNYDKFGDPNHRATFICEMHQARVLACRYYYKKLYKELNIDREFKLNIPKDWALQIISEDEYNELLND